MKNMIIELLTFYVLPRHHFRCQCFPEFHYFNLLYTVFNNVILFGHPAEEHLLFESAPGFKNY